MIRALGIITVCVLFLGLQLSAQKNWPVDELVFPCVQHPENISLSIEDGARAFIFDLDSASIQQDFNSESKKMFAGLKAEQLCLLAFRGKFDREALTELLREDLGSRLFFTDQLSEWPRVGELESNGTNVVVVFDECLTFSSPQIVKDTLRVFNRFSENPLHRMVVFPCSEADSLYNNAISLWTQTGRLPNLLLVDEKQVRDAVVVAQKLNATRRFIGRVVFNDEYLGEVMWRQKPGLVTPGCFSYPILEYREILSPYKSGYKITPGEVIHHTAMKDDPRYFNAYETNLEDNLVMDFSFDGDCRNSVDPQWNGIIAKDVSFDEDAERGTVLHFSRNNSFVDYSKENSLNVAAPFTVSMWVQPDSLPNFMGMIGVGTSFSFKLNRGRPDFTTADIKDHMVSQVLKLHQWQHLAVVFDPNSEVEFFLDGNKLGAMRPSEIKPSRQSLIIGNNIWSEQFFGKIDELKIWNRGLSEKEIKQVYQESLYPESAISGRSVLFGGLFALVIFFAGVGIILFFRRKKQENTNHVEVQAEYVSNEFVQPVSGIRLFGTFSIISAKEGELSTRFSPLLKQMLAFFILHAEDNSSGIDIQLLSDTFWPGAPKEKAKENRSANLKKLRKALEMLPELELVYEDKKWALQCNTEFKIDWWEFRRLEKEIEKQIKTQSLNFNLVSDLLSILKKGSLLNNLDAEWLDDFKNRTSEQVIGLLMKIHSSSHDLSPVLRLDLLRTVLRFDDMNEFAMKAMICILVSEGKHGQARHLFDEFARKYVGLYQSDFPVDFQEIIKNS